MAFRIRPATASFGREFHPTPNPVQRPHLGELSFAAPGAQLAGLPLEASEHETLQKLLDREAEHAASQA